jgi:hypothetical protein
MSHDTTDANQDSDTAGGCCSIADQRLARNTALRVSIDARETRTSNDETRKHEREKIRARA